MDNQDVLYTKEGGIATITLNRPDKMNAFIPEIAGGINRLVREASQDDEVRVIVITGTGKAFCTGADVKAMASRTEKPMILEGKERSVSEINQDTVQQLQKCGKPVIAAVNGVAAGGGLDLALACDIRLASDKARFSMVYVRRGLLPVLGGTFFLPRLVGLDKACQLIWTGDMVEAKEAERIGLVTMVVPDEELESTTLELAEKLAKGPTLAIQKAKHAIYQGLTMDLSATLKYINTVQKELSATADHREGATSFVEKRAPVFKGK